MLFFFFSFFKDCINRVNITRVRVFWQKVNFRQLFCVNIGHKIDNSISSNSLRRAATSTWNRRLLICEVSDQPRGNVFLVASDMERFRDDILRSIFEGSGFRSYESSASSLPRTLCERDARRPAAALTKFKVKLDGPAYTNRISRAGDRSSRAPVPRIHHRRVASAHELNITIEPWRTRFRNSAHAGFHKSTATYITNCNMWNKTAMINSNVGIANDWTNE